MSCQTLNNNNNNKMSTKIIFQQAQRVFVPGDLVSGHLIVDLREQINFKKIKVTLVGRADVRWTEGETEYRSSETYVDEVVDVHQGPGLPPGHHLLPFSVRLPSNLPSSFKGQYGGVSYWVKATIMRDGWRKILHVKVNEQIMITGILDLNLEPTARQAGSSSRQKNLGCFCWRPGTIMASLHTDRTGYISGETISFNVEVENLSSSDMDSVLLSLVEVVTFKTSKGNGWKKREVARLSWFHRILARSGDDWEGSLTLPILPPTGLAGHCSIIDLQYRLELHLNPAFPSMPLVVSLPIILGTRPLQDSTPTFKGDDLKPSWPPLPPSYTDSQGAAASIAPP